MSSEIVKKEDGQMAHQSQPQNLVAMAIEKGFDADQLGKLLDMQERHESNEARKAYVSAMAAFKENPPSIVKDKQVSYSGTNYRHASLANITSTISSALAKHGLTASWKTKQDEQMISVTCRLTHSMGHFEETSLSSPPDSGGKMNNIQRIGSALTYLQRYTLMAICGLAAFEDDDGAALFDTIDASQQSKILEMMTASGADADRFLGFMGVGRLEDIKKSDYNKAVTALSQKAKGA